MLFFIGSISAPCRSSRIRILVIYTSKCTRQFFFAFGLHWDFRVSANVIMLPDFGWNVVDLDGHNHKELFHAMSLENENIGKPLCLIANTTKGKGVSFMEGETLWHYRSPQGKEYDAAMKELKENDA